MSKPVILSCFAQNPDQRELKFLEDEFSAMRDTWRQDKENHKKSYYEVDYLDYPATKIQDIPKYISMFQDSIILFHYGGHAGSQKLFLKDGIGHGVGLAALLGGIETLKLVFLNGCATYDQVDMLFDKGVKAVIATRYAIGDKRAQAFASTFYKELAKNEVTIQKAYNHAIGAFGLEDGVARNLHSVWNRGLHLKEEDGLNVWGLSVNPGDESLLNDPYWWKIRRGLSLNSDIKINGRLIKPNHNLSEQLAAGSEQYYRILTGLNGPYHHLDISEAILAGMIPAEAASKPSSLSLAATVRDNEGQEFTLEASLTAGRGKENPHILLLGDGGMGKTVSLIHLWKLLLEKKRMDIRQPIPLFLTLKEYNTVSESERYNFIANRVAWHYLGIRKDKGDATNAFWNYITDKPEQGTSRLVFLLDGFNEITLDASLRSPLLMELQEFNQKASAVQMVLSSRHEMNFNWARGFQTMALQLLDSRKVETYLSAHSIAIPDDFRLGQVLQNPMMLTLYANSSEIVQRHKANPDFAFKPFTTTQGELLWNYLEAQTVKLSDLLGIDTFDFNNHKFIIQHFLPYIGFEMEKEGKFEVEEKRLEQFVNDACKYFYNKEFIQAYPVYRTHMKGFNLQELDFMEEGERFERIKELISRKLHLMKQKRKSYEFIHQNFRDYFAAVHILNVLHQDILNNALPQILKNRTLSIYVRRLIGQISGEAYQCEVTPPSPTTLMRALDAFRGVFETEAVCYSIWNIVNVWK